MSAYTPVTLPASADGQLSFQSPGPQPGFSVAFAPSGSDAAGEQQGGTVFYPNIGGVSDDTDVVATAAPRGAEITYMLRSADSPQTQDMTFSLPHGWRLSSAAYSDDVSVLSPSGDVEALVMAPVATDAQGQEVPASYTIQGADTIEVSVQDQGSKYEFPIQVDPNLIVIGNAGNSTFNGWAEYSSQSSIVPITADRAAAYEGWSFGPGSYGAGAQGNFTLNAGPSNAFISQFLLYGVYSYPDHTNFDAGVQPVTGGQNNYVAGTWISSSGNGGTSWAWRQYGGTISNDNYTFVPSGTNGTTAEFDLTANANATQNGLATDWADGVSVSTGDNNASPSMQVTSSMPWVNSNNGPTESVSISDSQPGDYGIYELDGYDPFGNLIGSATSDGACSIAYTQVYCDDIPGSVTLNYPTHGLPEGIQQGTAVASAYDGASSQVSWNIGVDNTPPVIAAVTETMGANGASAQIATTAGDAVSGIQTISGTLDGQPISPTSGSNYPCESAAGTGCSATATFTPSLTVGWHTITLNASDYTGNQATPVTEQFPVVAAPTMAGTAAVGQTLRAEPAAIPGTAPKNAPTPIYTYQWMSCGPTGQSCENISGETTSSYTVQAGDAGSEIEVQQTATIPGTGLVETSTTSPSSLIEPASGPACTDEWLPKAGGTWGVAANWSTGQIPSSSDVVCIRPGGLTISAAASAGEIQAAGATITISGGLTVSGTTATSDISMVTLDNNLAVAGNLLVNGLVWSTGTISGPGTLTVRGGFVTVDAPHNPATLNGVRFVNKGRLELAANGYNWTYKLSDLLGENGAILDNKNQLELYGRSPAAAGIGFKAIGGARPTFENEGTLTTGTGGGAAVLANAWSFDQTDPAASIQASVTLMGGESAPISGNGTAGLGALDVLTGGAYSISDDLANFGGASIAVATPPPWEPANVAAMETFLGASSSVASLTIASGEWESGTINTDGQLTLGQDGAITTVGSLSEGTGGTITVQGTVNAESYTAGTGTMSVASGGQFNVYGTTGLSGTETIAGSGASVDFQGPIAVTSDSTITTAGGLVLGGAVSGTGDLAISVGGPFYEEGGVNLTGSFSVQGTSAAADVDLTDPISVTGQVNLTTTGRIIGSAGVTAADIALSGGGEVALASTWTAAGTVKVSSPAAVEVNGPLNANAITLSGGGTATLNGAVTTGSLEANEEVVDNENVLTLSSRLLAENGAQIVNDGGIDANNVVFAQSPTGPSSQLINGPFGALMDSANPSGVTNIVALPYSGPGTVSSAYLIRDSGAAQYGGGNPATPTMVEAACDNATDCGNGDQTEHETDLTAAGLGGGLALTRTYSSRLAGAEASPGMFGYGWTTPFEQRLVLDSADGTATVTSATGSTATFKQNADGSFTGGTGVYATLTVDSNGDGGYRYVLPDQTTTAFRQFGGVYKPVSVTDRQGQVTAYTYNGQGQLTGVTAPSAASGTPGRAITFTYIASGPGTGLVATASDPAGLTVSYSYDANNNLVGVSDSQGVNTPEGAAGTPQQVWSFQYDGDGGNSTNDTTDLHELTQVQDAAGKTTTMTYEGGYVTSVTDPMGRKETWQYSLVYNGSANVENAESETIQTSPAGNVTAYYMNSLDEPLVTFEPNGAVLQYSYSSNGDLLSETTGNVNTTKYTYDSAGNKLTETTPATTACPSGCETVWTYDSERDVLTQTLPSKLKTSYVYDSGGEPTSVTQTGTDGTTEQTTMAYNASEELTSKTTDLGDQTTYTYDPYGDLQTTTDPLGNETTYGYDADGRQTCETTPRITAAGSSCVGASNPPSGAQSQTYDLLGDVLSTTTPAGNTTIATYDADRRKLTSTDPDGNETSYTYDADGELTQTKFADGSTQTSTYSPEGNILTQTNGDTQTYTYTYNSMDALASSTDPLGHKTTYGYDPDGNLTTVGYPNGKTTTYSYDADDRKTGTSYSDGEPSVSDSYYPDGQLQTIIDASGTTGYGYDKLDRLTGVCTDATSAASGCPGGRQVSYGYNADNDQTSIGYPNGQTVTQGFNNDDQLNSATDWLGNTTTFNYTKDSALATTIFPAGTGETDTYAYNADDALTGVTMAGSSGNLSTLSYTRDADELISAEAQTGLPGPTSANLTYTKTLELSTVTPANQGAINYAYDKAKNITQLDGNATALAYNADSELTSGPAGSYAYNTLGERTSATPSGGIAATYSYNQDQDLTAATTTSGASASYTYNGAGQLMSSTTGGNTTRFTWDDTATDPALLQAGSESYIYGPDGAAVAQISSSGTVQYLHHDDIGSTRLITNASGAAVGAFTYNPYGATTGALAGSTGTATSLLGYAGEYTDPTTGFTYNQARWYDPATAQFMVVDPKLETTWMPYAYANDNPITTTDPSGQFGVSANGMLCGYGRTAKIRAACVKAEQKRVGSVHMLAPISAAAKFIGAHAGQIAEGAVVVACTGASGGTATTVCLGATVAAFGGATAQSIAQHRFSIAGTFTDAMMAVPGMQGAAFELMPEATYGKILTEEARAGNLTPVRLLGGATGAGGGAYSWEENH